MRWIALVVLGGAAGVVGCHSAYVQATVENRTGETIPLVEVDYPSASFGLQNLRPGGDFHYRFKVLGSGATAVLWTDAGHHEHKAAGPELREGDEGKFVLVFGAAGPVWSRSLNRH